MKKHTKATFTRYEGSAPPTSRYYFVCRQLQSAISQVEHTESDDSSFGLPHVHFHKKHRSLTYKRFSYL